MYHNKYHNSFDDDSEIFTPNTAPVRTTHNRTEISNISLNQSSIQQLLPNSFDDSSSILDTSVAKKPSRTIGTGGLMNRNSGRGQTPTNADESSDYIPTLSMNRSNTAGYHAKDGPTQAKPSNNMHMSSILMDDNEDSDSDWDKSPAHVPSKPTGSYGINAKSADVKSDSKGSLAPSIMLTMEKLQSLFSTSLISSNSIQFRNLKLSYAQDYADTRTLLKNIDRFVQPQFQMKIKDMLEHAKHNYSGNNVISWEEFLQLYTPSLPPAQRNYLLNSSSAIRCDDRLPMELLGNGNLMEDSLQKEEKRPITIPSKPEAAPAVSLPSKTTNYYNDFDEDDSIDEIPSLANQTKPVVGGSSNTGRLNNRVNHHDNSSVLSIPALLDDHSSDDDDDDDQKGNHSGAISHQKVNVTQQSSLNQSRSNGQQLSKGGLGSRNNSFHGQDEKLSAVNKPSGDGDWNARNRAGSGIASNFEAKKGARGTYMMDMDSDDSEAGDKSQSALKGINSDAKNTSKISKDLSDLKKSDRDDVSSDEDDRLTPPFVSNISTLKPQNNSLFWGSVAKTEKQTSAKPEVNNIIPPRKPTGTFSLTSVDDSVSPQNSFEFAPSKTNQPKTAISVIEEESSSIVADSFSENTESNNNTTVQKSRSDYYDMSIANMTTTTVSSSEETSINDKTFVNSNDKVSKNQYLQDQQQFANNSASSKSNTLQNISSGNAAMAKEIEISHGGGMRSRTNSTGSGGGDQQANNVSLPTSGNTGNTNSTSKLGGGIMGSFIRGLQSFNSSPPRGNNISSSATSTPSHDTTTANVLDTTTNAANVSNISRGDNPGSTAARDRQTNSNNNSNNNAAPHLQRRSIYSVDSTNTMTSTLNGSDYDLSHHFANTNANVSSISSAGGIAVQRKNTDEHINEQTTTGAPPGNIASVAANIEPLTTQNNENEDVPTTSLMKSLEGNVFESISLDSPERPNVENNIGLMPSAQSNAAAGGTNTIKSLYKAMQFMKKKPQETQTKIPPPITNNTSVPPNSAQTEIGDANYRRLSITSTSTNGSNEMKLNSQQNSGGGNSHSIFGKVKSALSFRSRSPSPSILTQSASQQPSSAPVIQNQNVSNTAAPVLSGAFVPVSVGSKYGSNNVPQNNDLLADERLVRIDNPDQIVASALPVTTAVPTVSKPVTSRRPRSYQEEEPFELPLNPVLETNSKNSIPSHPQPLLPAPLISVPIPKPAISTSGEAKEMKAETKQMIAAIDPIISTSSTSTIAHASTNNPPSLLGSSNPPVISQPSPRHNTMPPRPKSLSLQPPTATNTIPVTSSSTPVGAISSNRKSFSLPSPRQSGILRDSKQGPVDQNEADHNEVVQEIKHDGKGLAYRLHAEFQQSKYMAISASLPSSSLVLMSSLSHNVMTGPNAYNASVSNSFARQSNPRLSSMQPHSSMYAKRPKRSNRNEKLRTPDTVNDALSATYQKKWREILQKGQHILIPEQIATPAEVHANSPTSGLSNTIQQKVQKLFQHLQKHQNTDSKAISKDSSHREESMKLLIACWQAIKETDDEPLLAGDKEQSKQTGKRQHKIVTDEMYREYRSLAQQNISASSSSSSGNVSSELLQTKFNANQQRGNNAVPVVYNSEADRMEYLRKRMQPLHQQKCSPLLKTFYEQYLGIPSTPTLYATAELPSSLQDIPKYHSYYADMHFSRHYLEYTGNPSGSTSLHHNNVSLGYDCPSKELEEIVGVYHGSNLCKRLKSLGNPWKSRYYTILIHPEKNPNLLEYPMITSSSPYVHTTALNTAVDMGKGSGEYFLAEYHHKTATMWGDMPVKYKRSYHVIKQLLGIQSNTTNQSTEFSLFFLNYAYTDPQQQPQQQQQLLEEQENKKKEKIDIDGEKEHEDVDEEDDDELVDDTALMESIRPPPPTPTAFPPSDAKLKTSPPSIPSYGQFVTIFLTPLYESLSQMKKIKGKSMVKLVLRADSAEERYHWIYMLSTITNSTATPVGYFHMSKQNNRPLNQQYHNKQNQ